MNKTKATMLTMILNIMNSVMVTIFNIVYTRMLLAVYGSEVNGLISTITQFVSFFSIIEGGFTTAVVVSTFEPVAKKDFKKLNDILFTAQKVFLKISIILTFIVLLLGLIYVNVLDSPFSYQKTYVLLGISVLTTVLTIGGLSKYTVTLQGYNREYVATCFTMLSKIITWGIAIVFIIYKIDIVCVFFCNALNVLLNIFFISIFEKVKMPQITFHGVYNRELIKGTGDVFFQKIANTVFNSTDLVLVSACISLSAASVYNLYTLIFKAIATFLSAIVQAPFNSFGQMVRAGSKEEINTVFDMYVKISVLLTTIMFSITGVMFIPFLKIYTSGLQDYNYIYPILVLLFFSQYFMQIVNRPFGAILNVKGKFNVQNKQCLCAVIINLVISVAFIELLGMYSIVMGSVIATAVILVMNVLQAYKYVICESPIKTFVYIIINYGIGVFIINYSHRVDFNIGSYLEWGVLAVVISLTIAFIIILLNYWIDKKSMKKIYEYVFSFTKRMLMIKK